jgi:hypothetical protein
MRVFQFSERPRATAVVHFESVGGASSNPTTRLAAPAGFQLLLQSLLHSADITTSAYNPSFKHVAVADAAGMVSLVDLSKPAVLWLQVGVVRRSVWRAGGGGSVGRGRLQLERGWLAGGL